MSTRTAPRLFLVCLFSILPALTASAGTPPAVEPPCQSLELAAGSFALGTSGLGHDLALPDGTFLPLQIARRCAGGDLCETNADCAPATECAPTCDTLGLTDTTCELVGPPDQRRCQQAGNPCTMNEDCPQFDPCVRVHAPPVPVSVGGIPICIVSVLDDDVTGTLDLASGASALSVLMRWRLHLGISDALPCPRCGDLAADPRPGDAFMCNGGPNDGTACTVDAVSALFGGVSNDCPPANSTSVTGQGLALRLNGLTTGSISRQATLPCAAPFNLHPSLGNAICNEDPFDACETNADCSPGVTCGFYCHCGFCDSDPNLPCFADSDCDLGSSCVGGAALGSSQQQEPNGCFTGVCGTDAGVASEQCGVETPLRGSCEDSPTTSCALNSDCVPSGGGECVFSPRSCFETVIARNGASSALTRSCALPEGGLRALPQGGASACTSNADCAGAECTTVCPTPTYAAAFCAGPSAANFVNGAFGLTGPGTFELRAIAIPPTGPTTTSTTTTTSTSTTTTSMTTTTTLPAGGCGQPVSSGPMPTASDCLFILRAAVGGSACSPPCICDVDSSGGMVATDALVCLKTAVGQPGVALVCPCA